MIMKNIFISALFFIFLGLFSVNVFADNIADDALEDLNNIFTEAVTREFEMVKLAKEREDIGGVCEHVRRVYIITRFYAVSMQKMIDKKGKIDLDKMVIANDNARIVLEQMCSIQPELEFTVKSIDEIMIEILRYEKKMLDLAVDRLAIDRKEFSSACVQLKRNLNLFSTLAIQAVEAS